MVKITEGAGLSYAEAHEQRRRQKGDRDAERNQAAEAIYRKDLWNFGLPVVSLFWFFFWLVDFDTIPSPAGIGLLLILSIATYLAAIVLGLIATVVSVGFTLATNRWRRRQDDRILNLREDDREALVQYAFGGDKLICRYIVLKDEIREWAKQSGVKMAVLTTFRKQGDIPLVWFKKPEHAVAFKMRWY